MDRLKYQGLSQQEVQQRVEKGQVNISHDNISKSKKEIILEHTLTYFNFLNLFLAAIVLSTGHWKNLTFIFVIFVNSIVGIFQEFKVKKIIDQLIVVTVKKVKAIREGMMKEIPIEDLVIDDVIFLESGNQIGTDCTVLESHGMEVNESMLTGESIPVKKSENDELMSGSFIVAGSGYARVIRVGNDNYSTQLVHKAKHKNKASSEMKDAIEKVIKVLSIVIIPVGVILFFSQLAATPDDYATAIVGTVAGIIGMIPEGLVLLTSLSFIIGVGKLAKKRAMIQEMEAIEALARVDVLCLDKTGTITTGELGVEKVVCLAQEKEESIHQIMGAIAYSFDDVNVTQQALQDYFPRPDVGFIVKNLIPFSSQRKMRAISFENEGSYVLGAAEFLTDDQNILDQTNAFAAQGLRVLLLGTIDYMDSETSEVEGIHPIALVVIHDCIRPDAKETLRFFDKQNVDIRILSGDNPVTVSRVAQQAGLIGGDQYIDSSTLPTDEKELQKVVNHYHVFGRIKPEQKQMIVKALQANGHVVGMVGDGVNDVLAIKDADCGIAMAAGSDAAKQAAHIVLLDSNFASMVQIVEEGKKIISNIERVSSLYLTKTIYSTALCLIFALLRQSYPFIPIQLSLISSLAIGFPSFYLTLEQSSSTISEGFLKHVILTAVPCATTMVIYLLGVNILGHLLHFSPDMYYTYYFMVAGFISFLVVFIVCSPLNIIRATLAVGTTIVFYLTILFMPGFFGVQSFLNMKFIWVLPILASTVFVIGGLKRCIHMIYKIKERKRHA